MLPANVSSVPPRPRPSRRVSSSSRQAMPVCVLRPGLLAMSSRHDGCGVGFSISIPSSMYTSAWRSSTSFESCRCSCSFAQLIKNWAKVFRSKLSKPKISIREIHGPSESAAPRAWLTSATSHSNSHAYSARTRPSWAALSSAPILGLLTVSTFPAFTVRTVRASWNCCGSSPKHSAAGASFPAIKWSMPSSTDQIRSCFSSSSPSSDSAVQIFVKASGFSPVSRSFRNSVTMWNGRSSITRPRSSRKVDTDAPVKAPLRSKWI